MQRVALLVVLTIALALPAVAPPRVMAQERFCLLIASGSGRGAVQIPVPSWATQLRFDVVWSGLQLRVFVDGIVSAHDMYGDGTMRTVYTPFRVQGWGGTREIKYGGIMLDWVRDWTVYACGEPQPTPTPLPTATPSPTATPTPAPFGPGCISRVGERPVWVGEGGPQSLTLYGPSTGWWIVSITEDTGASGAQNVSWRVTTPTGLVLADRTGNGQIEVRAGMTVVITPYRTALTGPGAVGVWVSITADCAGLVPTPLVPRPRDDIREVEFGVVTATAATCIIELASVSATFTLPFLDPFSLTFPGVRICFLQKWLVLRWGDFNIVDWAIPILTLGLVWSAWMAIRRG